MGKRFCFRLKTTNNQSMAKPAFMAICTTLSIGKRVGGTLLPGSKNAIVIRIVNVTARSSRFLGPNNFFIGCIV